MLLSYPPVQTIDSRVLADFLIELPNYIGCKNFSIASHIGLPKSTIVLSV